MTRYVKATESGGRIVHIDNPHIDFHEEVDRNGEIVDGTRTCVVRDPKAQTPQTPAKPTEAPDKPTEGGCGGCSKPTIAQLVKGAYKLLKAVEEHIDVDERTIAERKAICEPCQHNDIGRCQSCGCILWAKIRTAGDVCPEELWGSVER